MPVPSSKKQKLSADEMERNLDISRLMSWIDNVDRNDKANVRTILATWYDECRACHAAQTERKGKWIPSFGKIVSKDENKRTNGTRSLLKPKLHPIVMCTTEGATVEEQKQKTLLNSAHRAPYFSPGQADRLNTFWLGLLDPQIPPVVKLPDEILSQNFILPSEPPQPIGTHNQSITVKTEGLRSDVLIKESQKPTLIGEYAPYAKMLRQDETLSLLPQNFVAIGEKAAGLIIACDLQNVGWVWDDKKRKSLLSEHAARYAKEGAPLTILAAWRSPELKKYCSGDDCVAWGKDGIELRRALTSILETKIAKLKKTSKIPEGVKLVAKCFRRRQIKGLKNLL